MPTCPPAPFSLPSGRGLLFACALALAPTLPARAAEWPPVTPEERTQTAAVVEPGADAEALFYDMRIEDVLEAGRFHSTQDHHVRLKLFTASAVERYGDVELTAEPGMRISMVEARTILPDGRVVPLDPAAIADRTIEREGGRRVRARSFAMPALEPGCIIEYRVRYAAADRAANYVRVPLQFEFPVRRFDLRVRPIVHTEVAMHHRTFHTQPVVFQREANATYRATFDDLPGLRVEPLMPPRDRVRSWMLIYYVVGEAPRADRFWPTFARSQHEDFQRDTRPGPRIREAVAAIASGPAEPEERLRAVFAENRRRVQVVGGWDDTTSTEAELERLRKSRSPDEILASGRAVPYDALRVFAAMCRAVGFDTRLVKLGSRLDPPFDPNFADDYFVGGWDVAVRIGDAWRIVDPSSTRLGCGMLGWFEEGITALVTGPEPEFIETPISDPWVSVRRSSADLELSADGALEGTVSLAFTGHEAYEVRSEDIHQSSDERLEHWQEELRDAIGEVDVEDLRVERGTDADEPVRVSARVRVDGYAQAAGRRLLVNPAFFRGGRDPLFTAGERRHAVMFPHPWAEVDSVRIRLPEGFRVEPPPGTPPVVLPGIGEHRTQLEVAADGRSLLHVRTFHFGEDGSIAFPANSYAGLRKAFDAMHERDHRALVLTASGQP